MANSHSGILVIGVGGHAAAVDPSTGTELWRTKLKSSQFVTVHQAGDKIFAGAGGELFALDPATGSIIWRNKLRGLGLGVIAFTSGSDQVIAAAVRAQAAAAAAGAASGGGA